MPDFIRQSLGYNLDDLKENRNMKYVKSRDTRFDGIISEDERTREKEEKEQRKLKEKYEKEIAKREKADREDYSYEKDIKKQNEFLVSAGEGLFEVAGVTISTGLGFVVGGMTTQGKTETLSEAATNTLAGLGLSNDVYDKTVMEAYDYVASSPEKIGKFKEVIDKKLTEMAEKNKEREKNKKEENK